MEQHKENESICGISYELGATYNKLGIYDSALYFMQKAKNINPTAQTASIFITIGETYSNLNRPDSAIHYFNQALCDSNISISQIADVHQRLYFTYKQKKDYLSAADHCFEMSWYLDSLHRADKSRALIEIQEKYELQDQKVPTYDAWNAHNWYGDENVLMGFLFEGFFYQEVSDGWWGTKSVLDKQAKADNVTLSFWLYEQMAGRSADLVEGLKHALGEGFGNFTFDIRANGGDKVLMKITKQ